MTPDMPAPRRQLLRPGTGAALGLLAEVMVTAAACLLVVSAAPLPQPAAVAWSSSAAAVLLCAAVTTSVHHWLAGRRVRQGDPLILSFAAANADPRVRPDQAAFTGGNNAFFSFGHGDHPCLYPAQEVAESIARTGIEVLLDRLPDADLGGPPQALVWRSSPWLRGLESLPVEFSPTTAVGGRR